MYNHIKIIVYIVISNIKPYDIKYTMGNLYSIRFFESQRFSFYSKNNPSSSHTIIETNNINNTNNTTDIENRKSITPVCTPPSSPKSNEKEEIEKHVTFDETNTRPSMFSDIEVPYVEEMEPSSQYTDTQTSMDDLDRSHSNSSTSTFDSGSIHLTEKTTPDIDNSHQILNINDISLNMDVEGEHENMKETDNKSIGDIENPPPCGESSLFSSTHVSMEHYAFT